MQQAAKPLSRNAVHQANDDFYRRHPEMVQNGKGVPIDATDPRQAKLRSEWLKSYEKHGGKVEKVSGKHAAQKVRKANSRAKKKSKAKGVTGASTACSAKGVSHTARRTVVSAPKPGAHSPNCDLVGVEINCEHKGRKPGREGILMVVPGSTASLGDTISTKLTVKGGCGNHPSWSVGGFWDSEGKGTSFHFLAKTWTTSAAGLFSLQNVSPHIYRVQVNACGGAPLVYEVQAYPPGQVNAKIDVAKMVERIFDVLRILPMPEEHLKQWEKKWFQGSIEYNGKWTEQEKSWKAFYEKTFDGGFDPLFGIQYRGPLYPATLVPGWLEKWVKAGLFFEIKFDAKFRCGVKGKYWPDSGRNSWSDRAVSGGGRGGGGLSLELKLVRSEIVEGAIAGETGLTAELAGTQGEEVKVEFAIEFEGVKGNVTLKAAWGIVELKREFQIIQKREILRHEWDFAEKE